MTAMDDEQGGGQVEQGPGSGILHVFGRQLKRFRECTEYDRAAFGSATGYSASTIASYEQGGGFRRRGSSSRRMNCWGRGVCWWR